MPDGITGPYDAKNETKDFADKIFGNTGNNQVAVGIQNIPPNNNNTHKIGNTFKFYALSATLEATCKKVTIYNSIEEAGATVPVGEFENNSTDITTLARGIELDENGKLFPECVFLVCEVELKNIKTSKEGPILPNVKFFFPDFSEEQIEFQENLTGGKKEGSRFYYGIPSEPDYFCFEQTETVTRSQSSSSYYYLSLPENESVTAYYGGIIRKDILSSYTGYLMFDSFVNSELLSEYVLLEYPKESVTDYD